ncbi:MAG: 1-aminocyclopropane-1-carboxylate deaminase [Epsilonproteobacteria bacterium]|nr:1-aminocyclopropane-1-carboxylate deaminase [Campylobacterota bacterium]
MQPTPISSIDIDGRRFLIKRDDLIDPYLAGNKYRKLYTLLNTPKEQYNTIISYGGTQSNAMLAIAKMCFDKGWQFIYYSKPLSKQQKEQKKGNYFQALKFGMTHKEIEHSLYKEFIANLSLNLNEKTFLLHQGGADKSAKEGIKVLADEILQEDLHVSSIATPSGTGTTALFLALNLPSYTVYTTPSIGDVAYLKTQMLGLVDKLPHNLVILDPKKKYPFGKLNKEFFEIYQKLKDAGIEFDLLYAPLMWKVLLEQTNEKILYIHSGGVSGNESMLERYKTIMPLK